MRNLSSAQRGLHLFAASGFAIAQPLFDLLARQVEFLISRGGSAAEVLLLTSALLLVPTLVAVFAIAITGLVSIRLANFLHIILMFLLFSLISSTPLLHLTDITDFLVVLSAIAIAAFATTLYIAYAPVRSFASLLAAAPLLFAALFLSSPGVWSMITEPAAAPVSMESGTHATDARAKPAGDTPIVLLVFDALPLTSLQDPSGAIDARDFPSFAHLAKRSTWYPRAVATGSYTTIALESLLTGRYPSPEYLAPLRVYFPENLFSLLAPTYEMNVVESSTLLYNQHALHRSPGTQSLTTLVSDVAILYAHIVLPKFLRRDVPSISRVWGNFRPAAASASDSAFETQLLIEEERREIQTVRSRDPVEQLRLFDEQIRTTTRRTRGGVLHFGHVVLPHWPWNHLPTGLRYEPADDYIDDPYRWPTPPWWSVDAYRRHLLQVGYADRLLGEVLATLNDEGILDKALLIVTADHGENFWPGEQPREPTVGQHLDDITNVPLFVKLPGQEVGQIDTRVAETVDLLPTIADVIERTLPWTTDGCSLVEPSCPTRLHTVTHTLDAGRVVPVAVAATIASSVESLQRKFALFPGGIHAPSFYAWGAHAKLIGRNIDEFSLVEPSALPLRLDDKVRAALSLRANGPLPARIVGLQGPREQDAAPPQFAVAINGTIRSIVPGAPDGDAWRVAAMLPWDALDAAPSELTVFEIHGSQQQPALRAIRLE
jgi:hypothetical protein